MSRQDWKTLNHAITECSRCPRLIAHCRTIAQVKRRQYREETYWGRPVPGFGDEKARLWIVGLAPAAHGANRTGRMFTGDSSGDWLYRELFAQGLASQAESTSRADGMKLKDVYIGASARCAPPDNKPTLEEMANCFDFLREEFRLLRQMKTILALGQIAFRTVEKLLREEAGWENKLLPFGHGVVQKVGRLTLVASYHPSRQNTQTGRLTRKMWSDVFELAKKSFRA